MKKSKKVHLIYLVLASFMVALPLRLIQIQSNKSSFLFVLIESVFSSFLLTSLVVISLLILLIIFLKVNPKAGIKLMSIFMRRREGVRND